MANNVVSTLRTSDIIRPRNGVITFGFGQGENRVSAKTQQNIRYIFKSLIEPFVNVRFVEKKTGKGSINFQLHSSDAYVYEQGSDIFLNRKYDNLTYRFGFHRGIGSSAFQTLIHETLHGLGLRHPGNYDGKGNRRPGKGPFLPYALDNTTNTVMSLNKPGNAASSPMAYDIAALRAMYGKRKLNSGRTTYTFRAEYQFNDGKRDWGRFSKSKLTLVDDGGYDTLDFTGLTPTFSGYVLDARAGGFSTKRSEYNTATYKPLDARRKNTPVQKASVHGTRLGLNTEVERVYGSKSNDIIYTGKKSEWVNSFLGNDVVYGNDSNEIIYGGIGSDTLYGGKGNDQLVGGNGGPDNKDKDAFFRDKLYGGDGKDLLYGQGGSDLLYGNKGDDIIFGGRGNDFIYGTDDKQTRDRDRLFGGEGADRFVLGDKKRSFYKGSGYALIEDWEGGVDKIRLGGGGGRYTMRTRKITGKNALDTGIYHNGDLIGVVVDSTDVMSSRGDFVSA
ncbi:MAG: hypothetical protein AAFO84_07120 [Cyanobacteria bacterium J06598_1]